MNDESTSLDRLHDLVLPPEISWWPPAPAWYWVLGSFALAALWLLVRSFSHWQQQRYRREALAELRAHHAALSDPSQRVQALTALAVLMKRVAITAYPRRETASLTGSVWLAFIDETSGKTAFAESDGSILETVVYGAPTGRPVDDKQVEELAHQVRLWITTHRANFHDAQGGLS